MKRIPQKTAVQTISYILKANQLITIIDYPDYYDCVENKNGKILFDDEAGRLNSYKYARIMASAVHGIIPTHTINGTDVLVLKLITSADDY